MALNGMCATSHPHAARVAVDMLQAGGNAADAAIAAATVLGICEPQMTGLGGDCFVLVKPAGSEQVLALNGSGRAPAGMSADALRAAGHARIPEADAAAVTIPGAVDAFCRLNAEHGALSLGQVLAPAIDTAEQGIPVAERVARDYAAASGNLTGVARQYYLDGGKPLARGDIFRAPGQAEVLRRIARHGRDGFYLGEVADDMVTSLRAAGGDHRPDDFAATACDWGDPISADYRGQEIVEHPPNGQGIIALLMAGILARFDLAALDPFGADRAHIEAEATKLAYDARNRFLADPAHMTRRAHLMSTDTADRLAGLIRMDRALPDPAAASTAVHRDTVYVSVIDRDRMAVSLIYSIFRSFGSGIASDRFGILFQNRGSGFSLVPGHPNEAGGGKRPMHTIIPAMLRQNGRVTEAFGVMGGQFQPTGHARYVTNRVDFGLDPQDAIDGPRCFASADGLAVERGYGADVRADLAARGHNVITPDEPLGGAQTVRIHASGVLEGASDPRKDGAAIGY